MSSDIKKEVIENIDILLEQHQRVCFKEATEAADSLMSALYNLRYAFMKDGSISPNGSTVWKYIPAAQDRLTEIQKLIEMSKESVK